MCINKPMLEMTLEESLDVDKEVYKNIWEKVNEIIFIMEIDKGFTPKCFSEYNSETLRSLGYSKSEFIKVSPSDIFDFNKDEINLEFYKNLSYKKYDKVEGRLKAKEGKFINVEAKMFFISKNEKKYVLTIASDRAYSSHVIEQFNGIFNGIPDVIKVFNIDHTIICMNNAGYRFYNKTPEEVIGKMCKEFLIGGQNCSECSFKKVVETKQMLNDERYIPELNKYMDVCYNPVIGEDGKILFVVERLRDITEKKIIDKILKENEERYKEIINRFPDPTVIVVDNKIVLANNEASRLTGIDKSKLVGSNVYNHFDEKYRKALHKVFRNVISQKKEKETHDIEFCFSDGRIASLEISYSYILYGQNPGVIVVIRDITHIKQELNKAAEFQKNTLQKKFPSKEFIDIKSLYLPANIVSGDFYRICKINENYIIGIVVDVRGKGISAALNISAFDILFLQEIAVTHEPINIVNNLNKKLIDFYDENYIAVCCFGFDFNKGQLNVVGAGINQFGVQKKGKALKEEIVEGPFLGMFEGSEFSEKVLQLRSGDRVFFYTDGLDFIFNEDKIIQKYMGKGNSIEFKEQIEHIEIFLYNTIIDKGTLQDDCTMIAMEVR